MKKTSNLLWGTLFIIIGLIFGLNALEITNINIFFDGWWTLFIIVPCFIGLFNEKEKTGNIIGLIIGICLLLASNNIIRFEIIWKLMFPSILVIIGLSLIFKDTINSKVKKEIKKLNKTNDKEYYATFGAQTLNYDKEEFKGCDMNAVFGGITCELQESIIKDSAVINATSIFGIITIKVPKDVKVKITSTPIFGGVSDEREEKNNDSKKILYINATCLFGGVEIK